MAEGLTRRAGRRRIRHESAARPPSSAPSTASQPDESGAWRAFVESTGYPWIWVGILVLTAGFQYLRGAPADGVAFTVMAVLLAADALGLLRWLSFRTPAVPRIIVVGVAVVLGLIVVIAPIQSALDKVTLILIGGGLFVLVWPDPRPREPGGPAASSAETDRAAPGRPDAAPGRQGRITASALGRAGIVWGVIAVAVCIWELINFFLGLPSAAATAAHPTISSLVEPFVGWPIGRIIFVAIWLLAGLALLRKGRER